MNTNTDSTVFIEPETRDSRNKVILKWFKLLLRSRTGTVGLLIVTSVVLIAIFAPLLAPHDPVKMNPLKALQPPAWIGNGTVNHFLGTDSLGRDILSRIIYGTRISLLVGACSVVVAGIIGMFIGIVSGYYGGLIDNIFMRIVDTFLAVPSILLILVMLTVFDPGILTLILVIGVTNWITYARVIRGEVLSLKQLEFVKAAKTIGTSKTTVMIRHLLPNVISSFIVISTLSVATAIILEASLSFLGLGIQPPTVSWGGMLSEGRDYLATNWWIATFPGIAITVTVLGIIFLGDWLRDVLDPKLQGRS
ncbi:ABC transporter permease [Virgibacillus necropolis]|uniref:ABC transporter permease n=1 Tax=Virgibacillus necropolis TaxID=163877 RepID=UPI003850F413